MKLLLKVLTWLYHAIRFRRKQKEPSVNVLVLHADGRQEVKTIKLAADASMDEMPLAEFLGLQNGGDFIVLPNR